MKNCLRDVGGIETLSEKALDNKLSNKLSNITENKLDNKPNNKPNQEKKPGRLRRVFQLLGYLKGMHFYMVVNCIIGLLYQLIPIAISFATSYMAGSFLGSGEPKFAILGLIIGLVLAHAIFNYGDLWLSHDIAYRLLYKIRQQIYERLEKGVPSYKVDMSSIKMATIATQDVESLEWFYAHTINTGIISITIGIIIIGVLCFVHYAFGLLVLLGILVAYMVPVAFRKRSAKDGFLLREKNTDLEETVSEGIQGMREIVGFDWSEEFIKGYKSKEMEYLDATIKDGDRRSAEAVATNFIKGFTTIAMLAVASLLVSSGAVEIAWVPVVSSLSAYAFSNLNLFMGMTRQFSLIFASADRVIDMLEFPELDIKEGSLVAPRNIESIEFENVSFKYPGSNTYALKDVSFLLKPGETIAIAGQSGSGKTTLINLLQRHIDPAEGSIKLNGVDIREYSLDSWKEFMSVSQQDSYLFNLSISENIKMNDEEATDADVKRVSDISRATQFIDRMPEGFDTIVGEKATSVL